MPGPRAAAREAPRPDETDGRTAPDAPVHDGAPLAGDESMRSRAPSPELLVESACAACGQRDAAASCAHCGCARIVGEYRVERVLAQTERGRVYQAVHRVGARVALKELAFATVPGAVQVEQFHREARVLRELNHAAIPRFVDAFQTGAGVSTRLYLAQEFVEGESLLHRLSSSGRIDEAQAKQLAAQVLAILEHLHNLNPRLIHRDLKPANLILRPDGRIALVDFDAARALQTQRTHGASIAGTFGYSPLEQLGGTVDATSDLYALGATLIHLLTGKPPSELLGPNMELRFAEQVALSPGFLAFLQKLTAREHASRFTSAALALRALHALEGAPHTSDEKRAGIDAFANLFVWELQQERRERRWRRGLIAGAIGLVLLGVIGSVAELYAWRPGLTPPLARVGRPALAPQKQSIFQGVSPKWKAPFGEVYAFTGTLDPMSSDVQIGFSISTSTGVGFEQLGAYLEGPGVRIEPDELHTRQMGAHARHGFQTIWFRLTPGAPLPTELVFGDSIRVPLDIRAPLSPR